MKGNDKNLFGFFVVLNESYWKNIVLFDLIFLNEIWGSEREIFRDKEIFYYWVSLYFEFFSL